MLLKLRSIYRSRWNPWSSKVKVKYVKAEVNIKVKTQEKVYLKIHVKRHEGKKGTEDNVITNGLHDGEAVNEDYVVTSGTK